MVASSDESTGPVAFGKYLLLGRIGKGGMAEVFLARPRAQQRLLAIKCIHTNLASSSEFVEMFIREGQLSVMLNHDAIVKTFEIGRVQGRHFICMEYVSGVDLGVLLRHAKMRSRIPVPHAIFIGMRIFEGLHYAHELTDAQGRPLNLVNRDVSPSNVRISFEGDVKLLDFGIAKAKLAVSSEIGQLKGKVSHMSPEQVRGLPLDRRSDIFSAGVMLHELLTLEKLFRAETDFQLLDLVRRAEVNPPSQVNPRVSRELDALVLRTLRKSAQDRFQTAEEVARQLREMLVQYRFDKSELRDFVRDLCAAEWRSEQERNQRCGSEEIDPKHEPIPAGGDYGELLDQGYEIEVEPPVAATRRQPIWIYSLLVLSVLLLGLAVSLLLVL